MTKEKAVEKLILAQSNYIYILENKPGFFSTISQKKEWKRELKYKYENLLKMQAVLDSVDK